MLKIKLTSDFVPAEYKNLFYKSGDTFDAEIISENKGVGIKQVFAVGNITGKPQLVDSIVRLIPIPDDKFIVVEGEYTPKTNEENKSKFTSVKYIALGIAIIGLISYMAVKIKK